MLVDVVDVGVVDVLAEVVFGLGGVGLVEGLGSYNRALG